MSEEDGRKPGLPGIFVTESYPGPGSGTLLWDILHAPGGGAPWFVHAPGAGATWLSTAPYPGVPRLSTA
jgi:hypothetical protein